MADLLLGSQLVENLIAGAVRNTNRGRGILSGSIITSAPTL